MVQLYKENSYIFVVVFTNAYIVFSHWHSQLPKTPSHITGHYVTVPWYMDEWRGVCFPQLLPLGVLHFQFRLYNSLTTGFSVNVSQGDCLHSTWRKQQTFLIKNHFLVKTKSVNIMQKCNHMACAFKHLMKCWVEVIQHVLYDIRLHENVFLSRCQKFWLANQNFNTVFFCEWFAKL